MIRPQNVWETGDEGGGVKRLTQRGNGFMWKGCPAGAYSLGAGGSRSIPHRFSWQ